MNVVPIDYRLLGDEPTRSSTINAKVAGYKMLCTFLRTMNLDPVPLTKKDVDKKGFIKECDVCKVSVFKKLATYMMQLKKENGS